MNQAIIFPNDVGGVAIMRPAVCGLTLSEIARKDVPAGKPYLFIPQDLVPEDQTFFDAFEADFSEPDGFGIGPRAWFIEQYQAELAAINVQLAPVQAADEDVLQYGERLNQWTASKESRIAQLNQMIAVQQAELEASA